MDRQSAAKACKSAGDDPSRVIDAGEGYAGLVRTTGRCSCLSAVDMVFIMAPPSRI